MEPSHSAAELAFLSSLVHNVMGWLLLSLAATLILAGLCEIATALTGGSTRELRVLGILTLGGAAVQLIVYEEDPGAHGVRGELPTPEADAHEHPSEM